MPEYSSDEHRRLYWGGRDPCDFAHETEWRVPQDFSFQVADVAFLTVASYEDEAARPPDESAAILPRGGNLTSMTRRSTVLPATEKRRIFRRALLVFVAVLVTGALTVGGADGTSAGKFRVVIEESGSVSSFQGRFLLYAASTDSGTSALQVQISPVRYRGGQRYEIHSGVDTMHGKKGGLKLTFSGPSVNAGPSLYIEYGTWRISSASGIYKGWKGGGNWGGTDNEQTYHLQWEGLVTR